MRNEKGENALRDGERISVLRMKRNVWGNSRVE